MTRPLAAWRLAAVPCLMLASLAAQGLGVEVVQPGVPLGATKGGFSVQPPAGWVCQRSAYDVSASRDGPLLNTISFTLRKHKKAFAAIKKDSAPDALPEDLAENYVADMKARPGISNVNVSSVEPADLGGQAAFKVRFTFVLAQEMGGVTFEEVALGAPLQDGLLIARYAAPQIHFFEASLPRFEETLRSLTLAPIAR